MIALETPSKIFFVNKIEKYKIYDSYVIQFNETTVYKSFDNKEDADLNYTELAKYLKDANIDFKWFIIGDNFNKSFMLLEMR